MGLRKQVIKGISWQAISQVGGQTIRTLTTIVLARILFPNDFGLVAMAGVFTGFADIVNEIGLGPAIIQRKKISEAQRSSAFWLNLGEGFLVFLIMAAVSGLVARFYNEDVLKLIIIISSTSFIISSLGTIHRALLMRKMLFKQLAIRNILGIIVYGITAVSLGLLNYGYWSLIFAGLAASLYSSLSLWFIIKWRPKFLFHWQSLRKLLGFGLNFFGANILNYLITNVDNLFIGRFLGATPLGIYSVAYRLALAPATKVGGTISSVTFPAYSKIHRQEDRLIKAFLSVTKNIAFLAYPALFGLFATAPEFIRVIYTDKWVGAIVPLQILCLAGAMRIIGATYSSVLMAKGRTDLILRVNFFRLIGFSVAVYFGIKYFGLIGAASGMALMFFIFVLVFLYLTTKLIRVKMIHYLKTIFPYIVSSAIMAGFVLLFRLISIHYLNLSDGLFLLISLILGAIIYLGLIYFWQRKIIYEGLQIIKNIFNMRAFRGLLKRS